MKVVLDTNVLCGALISKGEILDLMFNDNLQIFVPLRLKEEFIKYEKEILDKSGLSETDFKEICEEILSKS